MTSENVLRFLNIMDLATFHISYIIRESTELRDVLFTYFRFTFSYMVILFTFLLFIEVMRSFLLYLLSL